MSELRELRNLTTLRVGGPASAVLEPDTPDDLVAAVLDTWASGEPWLVLGGGSNILVADAGFPGTVIRVSTSGIRPLPATPLSAGTPAFARATDGRPESPSRLRNTSARRNIRLRVEAGEPWDGVVDFAVSQGLAGIEALSGIPGSSGAAPIQNIGAYGQELGSSLAAVEFLDYDTGRLARLRSSELALGYRTSVFKRGRAGVVTAIELELVQAAADGPALSAPIAYDQLAQALGVRLGARVPIAAIREAVLEIRAAKGMVLSSADPDSVSAGSFFTNPVVTERFARTLPPEAPRWPTFIDPPDTVMPLSFLTGPMPVLPKRTAGDDDYQVKLSAAWLIERAGIRKGFRLPGSRAAVSSKHTLALVNTGGATAEEIVELARYVRTLVQIEFGVLLQPEPLLLGLTL